MSYRPDRPNRRSIVVVVGLLMAALVGLAVTGMVSSMVIAQINRGMATAVNQSGTLRMQSYRVGVALADDRSSLAERQRRAQRLAREYEQRLTSHRLTDALPTAANDPVRLAYERVRWRWVDEMRRAVGRFVDAGPDAAAAEAGRADYLDRVDDFVDDIHSLVRVLEERAEQQIEWLRWIQAVALMATVAIVLVTLVVVQWRVVAPLGELLRCADRARTGDFSARTRFVGADELGRLGSAMNLMAEGLSRIYNELEDRVAEKTRDLARSNHSLELLYRTSRTLDESPLSDVVLRRVLQDVCSQLHLAGVALCLREGRGAGDGGCIGIGVGAAAGAGSIAVGRPAAALDTQCAQEGGEPSLLSDHMTPDLSQAACRLCAGSSAAGVAGDQETGDFDASRSAAGPRVFDFTVGDQERRFGLLRVAVSEGQQLEPWQRPLLQSLAGHVATVLDLRSRIRESRRLMLHEERSILARELHDSLAQSLSYLKIQTTRLEAALKRAEASRARVGNAADGVAGESHTDVAKAIRDGRRKPPATPEEIVTEIRTGISSAYRQLRELLTTFRLKMDGLGLGSALIATVEEFQARSHLTIELNDRMPADLLSPNEEVHVLQIVRESLSNVIRHAQATHCRIDLAFAAGEATVVIADDGIGRAAGHDGKAADHAHYGTTIMRERAESLGGGIDTESQPGVGTTVRLRFRPRLLAIEADTDRIASATEPMLTERRSQGQSGERT
jgi:two-component system, NarL family, nitrate/nitrite sensor histidine kinase NarX